MLNYKVKSGWRIKLEEWFHSLVDYAVVGMGAVIGWIINNLHNKATKEEVQELRSELKDLREKMFSTLATKEDFNKLESKLDKLIDREIDRGRKR